MSGSLVHALWGAVHVLYSMEHRLKAEEHTLWAKLDAPYTERSLSPQIIFEDFYVGAQSKLLLFKYQLKREHFRRILMLADLRILSGIEVKNLFKDGIHCLEPRYEYYNDLLTLRVFK